MVVTIHQPEHLPWLGFFDKARQADVLVLLDSVQFRKNYYQNRNRIRSETGAVWLTVPVLTKGRARQAIDEVEINNRGDVRWKAKCLGTIIQNYQKAAFWREHEAFFRDIYSGEWLRLRDLNEHIIRYMLAALSIRVELVRSSEMQIRGEKADLLLDICLKLGASTYLSGISGRDYLDVDPFTKAGIEVRFQEFHHPIYKQRYEPFVPCLSAVDLLLNNGPESPQILEGIGCPRMSEVFQ